MAERTVVWTATAAKQRREVLKYWTKRNHSTKYAEKLIKLIANHIQIILAHPESFKSTSYPETRESALGHFSMYYKLTNDHHLIITAFWDNRQDPKRLMEIISEG